MDVLVQVLRTVNVQLNTENQAAALSVACRTFHVVQTGDRSFVVKAEHYSMKRFLRGWLANWLPRSCSMMCLETSPSARRGKEGVREGAGQLIRISLH